MNQGRKCRVCGNMTPIVFNISLKATPVCERCATSIFIQQAMWYASEPTKKPSKPRMSKGVRKRVDEIEATGGKAAELFMEIYNHAKKDKRLDVDPIDLENMTVHSPKDTPVFSLREKGTHLDHSVWLAARGKKHEVELYSEQSNVTIKAKSVTTFERYVEENII